MYRIVIKMLSSFVLLFSTACSAHPLLLDHIQLYGRIDSNNVEFMKSQIADKRREGYKKKFTLIVTSKGGDANSLFSLMDLFKDDVEYIFVGSECLSACAEMVVGLNLPTYFGDKSTLGFHNGPTLDYKVAVDRGIKDLACYKSRSEKYRKFAKFDVDAADKVKADSLKIFDVKLGKMNKDCQQFFTGTRNKFWFPSVKQLRQIYGLKVEGRVPCSERQECLNSKVKEWWGEGIEYRMGEQDFVT